MSPLHGSVHYAGYWGPPTSTLDWCERNYEVYIYFVNISVYYRAYSRIAGSAAAWPLAGSARKQLLPSRCLLIRGNLDTSDKLFEAMFIGKYFNRSKR